MVDIVFLCINRCVGLRIFLNTTDELFIIANIYLIYDI